MRRNPVVPFKVRFTKAVRRKFLKTLAEGFSEFAASKHSGLNHQAYLRWKKDKPKWQDKADAAMAMGVESLEDEVIRRAKRGVLRPIVSAGKVVTYEGTYSDSLLKMSVTARSRAYAPASKTCADLEPAIAGAAAQLLDRLAALVEAEDAAERAMLGDIPTDMSPVTTSARP